MARKLLRGTRRLVRPLVTLVAVVAALVAPAAAPTQAQFWPGVGPGVFPAPWEPVWGTPWDGFGYGVPGLGYPGYGWLGVGGPPWMGLGGLGLLGHPPSLAPKRAAVRAETQRRTTVAMQDFFFLPEEITVPLGTTVTWTNRGGTAHTTTSTGIWDSGNIRPGQSWSAVFAVAGTFNYLCTIHPDRMYGRIVVEGEPAPATTGTTATRAAPSAAAAGALAAGPTNPGAILQQLTEAYNRGDVSAALALFADDATFQGAGNCMAAACRGRDAIQRELARAAQERVQVRPGPVRISGNMATGQFQVTDDSMRALGIQRLIGTVELETRAGKIAAFRVMLDPNDSQTAQFVQRMMARGLAPDAATAPSAAPAATGGPAASAMRAVLSQQANSGVSGEAVLQQTGDTTTVTVTLSGLQPNSSHAGHIHTGSCSGPIIFPLATIRADSAGQGSATATVNAPIDPANWWVQYHASDSPPGPPIACGQPTIGG